MKRACERRDENFAWQTTHDPRRLLAAIGQWLKRASLARNENSKPKICHASTNVL